jgi:hypothetical protein
MTRFLCIVTISLLASSILGQENAKVGTAGAQFLKIGLSARATGMGEAYIVAVDNSEAIFWNPGALARVEKFDISASYVQWPADIAYSGIALAAFFENIGTFGFHISGLQLGDMRVRTIYKPEGDGRMFTAGQFSTGLSFARFLTSHFSVGLTFKYIHEKFWDYSAKNWAIDIGTFYDTGFNSLVLGMSILNFGPEMAFEGRYIDYSDPDEIGESGEFEEKEFLHYPLPLTFRFGLAMYVYQSENMRVLTSMDTYKPNDNRQQVNAGLEFTFIDMLMLRGGYKFGSDENNYCFGAGFRLEFFNALNLRLDYSYADMGVLDIVHRGTFGVSF